MRDARAEPPPPPHPEEARRRVGQVATSLLALGLVTIAAFGMLIIWHLVRRGRLIREGLPAPKDRHPIDDPDEPPGTRPP